jgi:hypothetical protein
MEVAMSTVLEEKIPMVQHYLVEQYGQLSQSAVDAVAQGLKSAVSMGISSSAPDSIGNLELQVLGGAVTSPTMLGPHVKISEAAGVPSPEVAFQGQFKGLEKTQNAELNTFASNVFGQAGALKSLEEKGIIIICKPGESSDAKGIWVQQGDQEARGMIINGGPATPADTKGFVIYGSENPQSAAGIVGPEYKTMTEMEQTLQKTLKLQQDLQRFNIPVKA